ncbi:hypothetical protein N7468_001162 [Penicillium chermesinum]|uniref:DNA (cytosine-5)-methyltransferase 1 replication foci domain-containing protein n=1 Tax=Penicillium chermesinum TaxID=63820 RepID=A0A9W9PGB6_9EURO|nr:uncharacterized protein N7468_001162 [Penicillium chermesinum]KAJ5246179.1 hypothetical protein N7468_001162 [Penicillium chermesinum]
MTAREETVLLPIDPSISDENDWWEFSLSEVKVLRPGKHLYANLLEATEDNPVQVIGELQLNQDQEHLVTNPDLLSKRLLIDDVTHFAYGQTEDRNVELWVAGKAGWYKITPAKSYLPTYTRMVQAVDMYYFLMDKHQSGKKQLNPTYKNLCQQKYIYHTHGDCEDREQSAAKFTEHGPFLLTCMVEDDEDMHWNKTNIFMQLRRQFKEKYQELISRKDGSDHIDDEDLKEPLVSTPRHDPAAVSKSQTDASSKKRAIWRKRRLNLDLVSERLSERYSFNKEDAAKIIAARAAAVLEKLEDDDNSRWSRCVIHRELSHAAAQHESLPSSLLTPLQPLDDSSDDEQLARTQKSVLRPIASVSRKLIGKRNRSGTNGQNPEPDGDEADIQDDPDAMSDVETPSKTRGQGHELIRTPIPSARPRTRSLLSKTEPGPAASLLKSMLRKTPRASQTTATIESSTSKGPSDQGPSIPPLPPIDLEESLESEVWNCRMVGCAKEIRSKGGERKKEIEAHAGEHDWNTQMRVELIEAEQRMHSVLPVTNLMKYLVTQHYQQMRAAFPEIYAGKEANQADNDTNGISTKTENSLDGEPLSSPTLQTSAIHGEANGHR